MPKLRTKKEVIKSYNVHLDVNFKLSPDNREKQDESSNPVAEDLKQIAAVTDFLLFPFLSCDQTPYIHPVL
jgi:hypothetical protein